MMVLTRLSIKSEWYRKGIMAGSSAEVAMAGPVAVSVWLVSAVSCCSGHSILSGSFLLL